MPSLRRTLPLALGLISLAWAQGAFAAVLDFEDLSCARTQPICNVGESYAHAGYTLSYSPAPGDTHAVGLHAIGKLWPGNVGGSTALLANSCNASTTMVSNTLKPFSVLAMDLAEANADAPSSVAFLGTRSDGSQVRMTVALDGKPGWQRLVLPAAFYNLQALTWVQGDCIDNKSHMVDNILVVPGIAAR